MSNIAMCSKPSYKLYLSYVTEIASMRTAQFLVDTRAGFILLNLTFIPPQWAT